MAHIIGAEVRWRERLVRRANGGRLPRNTRPRLVEESCTNWAEAGDLSVLSKTAQEGLPAAVRQILDREPVSRPRPRLTQRAASASRPARQRPRA